MGSEPQSPRPTFAWSESRARRYQECRRKHYLAVHLADRGWDADAPSDRRLAWMLGKALVGWPAALGTTVHARAIECVRACASGKPLPRYDELRRAAGRDLNRIYATSRDHLDDFRRDPSRWPVLERRLYGESWCSPEELFRTRRALDIALEALVAADDLWDLVRGAGVDGVWVPGQWAWFTLAGAGHTASLRVYAAADVIVRPGTDAPAEVWDFKTGAADGVVDQVLTYALAVRDGMGVAAADGPTGARYLGRVVHLNAIGRAAGPAGRQPFAITDDDLTGAAVRIRASAAAMQAPLVGAAAGGVDAMAAFPRTAHRGRCPRCQYRGLCEPERFPLAGVGANRHQPGAATVPGTA